MSDIITETALTHPGIRRQKVWAAALMLTAALLFAVLGLFIKILGPGYRIWDIAIYRFVGGVLILLVFFSRSANLFRPHNPKLMIIRGVLGSLTFLSLVIAIRRLPLSTAMVLFNNTVLPNSNYAYRALYYDIVRQRASIVIREHVFVEDFDGYVFRVGDKNPIPNRSVQCRKQIAIQTIKY